MEKPIYEKIIIGSVTILIAKNESAVKSSVDLAQKMIEFSKIPMKKR